MRGTHTEQIVVGCACPPAPSWEEKNVFGPNVFLMVFTRISTFAYTEGPLHCFNHKREQKAHRQTTRWVDFVVLPGGHNIEIRNVNVFSLMERPLK